MKMLHTVKRLIATLTLLVFLPLMGGALAEEAFGSAAVTAQTPYTLDQMLTYAMQDEYMAQAEYDVILRTLGGDAPFSNIMNAETNHIAMLTELFTAYNLPMPANTAADKVTVPATLAEAYQAGVNAEVANIAMYDAFLAQQNLPDDVRDTFTSLKRASESHLNAFTRNVGKNGRDGMGQYGRGQNGSSAGNNTRATGTCGVCDGTCTLANANTQPRNQRNGNGNGKR